MQVQTTPEDHRNVITIVVLIQFGWRTAVWVSLLRVLCGSLLLGTFLSPGFFLSLGGAICSLAALWLGSRLPGQGFGPVGYSVLAALAHMTGQFTIAWLLFIPHPAPGIVATVPGSADCSTAVRQR